MTRAVRPAIALPRVLPTAVILCCIFPALGSAQDKERLHQYVRQEGYTLVGDDDPRAKRVRDIVGQLPPPPDGQSWQPVFYSSGGKDPALATVVNATTRTDWSLAFNLDKRHSDDVLAFCAAHEMGHLINNDYLEKPSMANEREADLTAIRLMRASGKYRPEKFFEEAVKDDGNFMIGLTYAVPLLGLGYTAHEYDKGKQPTLARYLWLREALGLDRTPKQDLLQKVADNSFGWQEPLKVSQAEQAAPKRRVAGHGNGDRLWETVAKAAGNWLLGKLLRPNGNEKRQTSTPPPSGTRAPSTAGTAPADPGDYEPAAGPPRPLTVPVSR